VLDDAVVSGALGLRESMKEADIEMILERAKEKYPEAKRGSSRQRAAVHGAGFQGVHSDLGDEHVRTSPFYPQVERKIEAGISRSNGSAFGTYSLTLRMRAADSNLRGSLQHSATAQRDRYVTPRPDRRTTGEITQLAIAS